MTDEPNEPKKPNRARRGRGEGSIYKGKDGRWVGRASLGYGLDGKRRRKIVYAETKSEAAEKLRAELGKSDAGQSADGTRLTIAEFLDYWIEHSAKATVRPSTLEGYRDIVAEIKTGIGSVKLAKLTPTRVQAYYGALTDAGRSARARQQVHAILHRALSRAVRWRMIPGNVCDCVDRPKIPPREMKFWTPDEARTFLDTAERHRLGALFVLAIATGARQGELLGLKWPDIDLDAGRLSIRRTLIEIKGELSEGEPKSAKGKRQLSLSSVAVEALHAHRKAMLAEGHAGACYVFCDTLGKPLIKSNLVRSFHRLVKRAKVPPIRFHDMRHSNATALLSAGVSARTVQERLGHSHVALTLGTYSHVMQSVDREAADKLDAMLAKRLA